MKNIPDKTVLDQIARDSMKELEKNVREAIIMGSTPDMSNMSDSERTQRTASLFNQALDRHLMETLERKAFRFTNQILIGAHVSEIIKLIKFP